MEYKDQVIYNIQDYLFDNNVRCRKATNIRLSHIIDNYFCIITKNDNFSFFSKKCPNELNTFYSSLYKLLFSENFNGMGCFDYERAPIPDSDFKNIKKTNNILDTVETYFTNCVNFILIEYSDNKDLIKPLAFFTYKDKYIWNVCTGIDYRNQGLMTLLLKHFFSLYKTKKLNYLKLDIDDEGLSLFLLKKNPEFNSIRKFYEDNGFKVYKKQSDKYIMRLVST